MGTRTVTLDLQYHGDGSVTRVGAGAFAGGVVKPTIAGNLAFLFYRQVPDEDGLLGPIPGDKGIKGSFQLVLQGNAAGYRELGRYFLALAELDSSADPDYHEHHDDLTSADGQTELDIVVRKQA